MSKLRKLTNMRTANDGTRSLFESTMHPWVIRAIDDWGRATSAGVLIGTLANSFHAEPRYCDEIHLLFRAGGEVLATVPGSVRLGASEFRHSRSAVLVYFATPSSLGAPPEVVEQAVATAANSDGLKVGSGSALVALKLFGSLGFQDQADIVALIKTGHVDLPGWPSATDARRV